LENLMKNRKTNGASGAKAVGKRMGLARKQAAKAAAPAKLAAKPDPRTIPAPTAPAAVAEKAVAAIAAVPAVAEAAPKTDAAVKAAAPKLVAKAAPAVAKPAAAAAKPVPPPAPQLEGILPNDGGVPGVATAMAAPLATALGVGADQARAAYARVQDTGDSIRQAVAQSTSATTRGLAEINGKLLDLIRAQNDATIDLWRSTLSASSLSDAARAQTSGLRHVYEATAAQWKDIAETAGRVMGEAAKPLRSAFAQGR
jgi:hypothetical protein